MTKAGDQIKSGILFEEDIVHVLAEDIKLMHGFVALPESTQKQIQELLRVMVDDSIRHKQLLQGIVEKY